MKSTLRDLPVWQKVVLVIFAGTIFLTVFGPHIGPYSATTASPADRLMPPSAEHWFGTDENGIDIFSRLLAAPRTDVTIAVIATAISVILGAPIGVVVALLESRRTRRSRAAAETAMRLLEVVQAFPVFVFAMVLVAVFGGTTLNIIAAVAFVNTPVFVRLVRSDVLSLIQQPFAEAARAIGNTEMRTGFRHVLPNAAERVVVQISVTVGFAILLTAGLSFVGAGVRPPTPELGGMIASGAKYLIVDQWWPALFPGVALGLIVFSFGVFGEILNKALEPRATRGDGHRPMDEGPTGPVPTEPDIPIQEATVPEPVPDPVPASAFAGEPDGSTLAAGAAEGPAILAVRGLTVGRWDERGAPLLDDIGFSLVEGECLGVVGESGSGKSLLVRSLLQLVPPTLAVRDGEIRYRDTDLLGLDKGQLRKLRSNQIAAILPNAKAQLHPLITVGRTMISAIQAHERISSREARDRSIELLTSVGLSDPARRLEAYPHELSGGMAQRVCVALALMHRPDLLIADEPTAGLDVTIQRQVLDLIETLAGNRGTARLLVTGDLGIAAHYCDRVAVMRAGRIIEINETRAFFANPRHAYSQHLVSCVQP
ncbi:dipeptide/oligopeptide/nickel ABC transporter permease/ATP-binding protein [Microbaculum marinum]|uniref:Dipeptide/oligopeptide/nickel ABC transporter permease/ATP-binding protein n=1 Tax=Microbaculum marinum TaxID=1764581 RepID=A0AAW9RII0_9HYPH